MCSGTHIYLCTSKKAASYASRNSFSVTRFCLYPVNALPCHLKRAFGTLSHHYRKQRTWSYFTITPFDLQSFTTERTTRFHWLLQDINCILFYIVHVVGANTAQPIRGNIVNLLLLLLLSKKLQDLRLVIANNSLAAIPVNSLNRRSASVHLATIVNTYYGAQEAVLVLAELLQGILIIFGTLNNLAGAALAKVLNDGLNLVGCRSVLSDVELEGVTVDLVLDIRVLSGSDLGTSRDLLSQVGNSDRGGRAGLVEDRDDIEGFTLQAVLASELMRGDAAQELNEYI